MALATDAQTAATQELEPVEYEYAPLPTQTSIRILRIHRSSPEHGIELSLKTVQLDDNPAYNALSYTWGNPHARGRGLTPFFDQVADEYSAGRRVPISCEGKRLYVQRNLHDALCHIPLEIFGHKDGQCAPDEYLWIDAVCINQRDLVERSAQVQIMADLYKKAARTIVWLGRDDEHSAAGARTVARIAAYPRDAFLGSDMIPFGNQESQVYEKSGLEHTTYMEWYAVFALLRRQWFERVWAVQECVLSPVLVFLCGAHKLRWSDLYTAAERIRDRCAAYGNNPSKNFIPHDEIAVSVEDHVISLKLWQDYVQEKEHSKAKSFTLENLLYDTWTFRCTDPRDRIYGLLGFMAPEVRATWRVDYATPVAQLFAEVTRRVIRQTGRLTILACYQATRSIEGLPSWVPDYSFPQFNQMCVGLAAAGEHDAAQVVAQPRWDRLRLRGAVVDEIVETGLDRETYVNSMFVLDPSWFELAMLLPQPYATGQPRTEALWRTLCADTDAAGRSPAPARFGALFRELVSAMVVVWAELEADRAAQGDAPPQCSTSLPHALDQARGWEDRLQLGKQTRAEVLRSVCQRPRFCSDPASQGWLVYTLFKLHVLALTEDSPCTPTWDQLDRFDRNPTYVMRKKEGDEISLLQPADAGFHVAMAQRYGRRKLFYTKSGCLGLGPAAVRVGDVVAVVPGAGGAFALRPYGCMDQAERPELGDEGADGVQRFQLLGTSYVHGIMHGEATRVEGFALQDIELL